MKLFEFAGGGIPGSMHTQRNDVLIGRNNQDAWKVAISDDLTIALVADGCGSQGYSEVGASLGTQLLIVAIQKNWERYRGSEGTTERRIGEVLDAARREVLAQMNLLAHAMLPLCETNGVRASFSATVAEYLLFTVVGAIVAPEGAAFFSIGDGLIVINGEPIQIGPFQGNEPPYMTYALLHTRWNESDLMFKVHRLCPLPELESFLIGTDGVVELAQAEESSLPGSSEPIGPLSQFWSEDRYFTKSGIRRRLARIQSRQLKYDSPEKAMDEGRLPDDTTLIVGRRVRR